MEDQQVMEMSLEKVIETKLVQNNVTEAVIAKLKEDYGDLRLKALDDKESYLELREAAKVCGKVRTLAVKVCKEGREEAVKTQKKWVEKEKFVVGQIAEVEDVLDAEAAKYEAEQDRLEAEEKNRQETAYINRQAMLIKMGATYLDGSFILGEASFEAVLIKGSDDSMWNEVVLPKFQAEYEKIESVKVEEERKKAAEAEAVRAEQEKFRLEQETFRLQQEEFRKQQEAAQKIIDDKVREEQAEANRVAQEAEFERRKVEMERLAEEKRLADVEAAIQKEKDRQAEEARLAEVRRVQEEAKKAEELAQAKDKDKWDEVIKYLKSCPHFEMRSGQYRKKAQMCREKMDEILSL